MVGARKYLLWLAALFSSSCLAGGGHAGGGEAGEAVLKGPVAATVLRVIDGDTVEVAAQIWIDQELRIAVRLANVDAPELFRPKCAAEKAKAMAAKNFAAGFFARPGARLTEIRYGKYAGRVVARIENAAGADLGQALVDAGLAARGQKGAWCGVS